MAEQFQGDRTERPSPKRLKDARERGQVASSRDLAMAAGSLAATAVLVFSGSFFLKRLASAVETSLRTFARTPLREVGPEDLTALVANGGTLLGLTVGPIALAAAAIGALSTAAQTGFIVAPTALQLNWQRLSPSNGLARLTPARAGVDTLKTILTSTVLAFLAWRVGRDLAVDSSRLAWMAPLGSAGVGWTAGLRILWQAGLALLAIGAIDFGLQKWRLWSSLKMTRQEVLDEAKSAEGNPQIKARVRRIQRDMVRRRMLQAVPRATVVLTNPTHFAVALEYRRERHAAPIVVAKGRDLIAARIREVAREHSVPIVENPPLARALFKDCEIGDTIPGPLFGAVAEVLAYLVRIKQLVL
jgi:flagellar biosynthetic protein FlhB